jgi:RNA polymerase sigma-70 factor (ECF subfamily)
MMTPSDHDLMGRIQQRDEGAFEVLFARYGERTRRHLVRTVRDPSAAEDLVQEVFLRVWTRAERWDACADAPKAFRAWLLRIATNLALNHLRSVRRRREQPLEVAPDPWAEEDDSSVPGWMIDASALGPQALLELAERRALLGKLIDDLPEDKREVFRLVHDQEMEIRDVAHTLAIPEGTVKSRLHYARKRLAHEWEGLQTDEEKT